MSIRSYDFGVWTAAIAAHQLIHERMADYLDPYLVEGTGSAPDFTVSVDISTDPHRLLDQAGVNTIGCQVRRSHPEYRYRAWLLAGRTMLAPLHRVDHVITVDGRHLAVSAREHVAATIGVRVARQLIMRGGESAGGHCVHAGAVELDGVGVLVGGRPGAGKTSVLTHLIERHGAVPVSNDRTMLMPTDSGDWTAVAVPLAWRISPEANAASPRLRTALASASPIRGRGLVDGKLEWTPAEIGRILGVSCAPATSPQRIVILMRANHRTGHPSTHLLRRHLGFGNADFFTDDWLSLRPSPSGGGGAGTETGSWWSTLADVPASVLGWTEPDQIASVADTIADGMRSLV
ncbi:hypothetical protein [Nocardia sp. NPDC047038]|uniref:hypothetical protein n=1 Tax=Nocardia sp. NPDC047038 TaxID=3154338 RepID=UPI0033F92D51